MNSKESKQDVSKLFKMFKIKNLKQRQQNEHNIFDSKLKQIRKPINIQIGNKYKQNEKVQNTGEMSLRNSNKYLDGLVNKCGIRQNS